MENQSKSVFVIAFNTEIRRGFINSGASKPEMAKNQQ